jgi:hypothetical protein
MPRTPDDDGFLTRWSRRKRELEAEAKAPVPAEPTPAPQLPQEAGSSGAGQAASAEPEPEMVEPPSLESVDKDFDLAHWLKQNVPESWKLAALRRVWETDPVIRDFVNPAREYALDWNTPGGAPGYGPLGESDDVKAMLAQLFPDATAHMPRSTAAVGNAENSDEGTHELSSKHDDGEGVAQDHAALQQIQDADFASENWQMANSRQNGAVRRSSPALNGNVDPHTSAATHKNIEAVQGEVARAVPSRRRGGGAMPT